MNKHLKSYRTKKQLPYIACVLYGKQYPSKYVVLNMYATSFLYVMSKNILRHKFMFLLIVVHK